MCEYERNIGLLPITPILPHKCSRRSHTTHYGVFVSTVQEFVDTSLDDLEDYIEINSKEGNEGPTYF